MLAFKNPLDTDVDRPGWEIGQEEYDTKLLYAGPKYGMKTREEYNKLLESGALGRGQQAVELTGQQILDHGKNIYNKVGEVIPDFDLPEMSPEVKNAVNTAGQLAGKVWEISGLQRQVNQTMNILDAPVKGIAWASKQVDPTKRGIGEAPLRVAETALPFVGGAKNIAKKGIQKGLQYSDEILDTINISKKLQPAYATVGVTDDITRGAIKTVDTATDFKPNLVFASSTNRADYAGNLSPTDARKGSGYKQDTEYPAIIDERGVKVSDTITDVHHAGELSFQNKAVVTHKSFAKLKKGQQSPIVKYAEKYLGLRSGNAKENLIDIFGHDPLKLRRLRIEGISKQLKGRMHSDTINDLLGTTDLKFTEARNLEDLTSNALHNLQTTKGVPRGNRGKALYPEVKIKDVNGNVIEVWQPTTQPEWDKRFTIVREKLGIKEKIDFKKILLDPSKDVMGIDHPDAHRITNHFKKTNDGNPMNVLQQSIESGEYANLSVQKAAELYADSHRFQEQVAGHVLQYRYKKLKEVFAKQHPELGGDFFDKLSRSKQQEFVRANAAEIAVKGGIEKRVSIEQAAQPLENWTEGMTNVFGWQPQLIK